MALITPFAVGAFGGAGASGAGVDGISVMTEEILTPAHIPILIHTPFIRTGSVRERHKRARRLTSSPASLGDDDNPNVGHVM
jgi:hypothetical protein